ncbi:MULTISPECIES: twin-arginine translocase subunit TatC [Psychroflexus]|uniref:Sec-independent protein translocase protein TatC n=1 Tax=Psychroflexus halocasei TaxID=908615 RepID=A0A1H4C6X7_9FLAO|nr:MULTISPECIES: twin-arginine translocase subunit TatC [Psychroflexus]MDN6343094.1 twin-arginine translocase subunit TatC [Lactococcus lactis]PJX24053.1 twin-arginine translocase subunit TatC [Psychroflexus sp. S27]SEA56161.1 sec-independent protein translocase protein TatC [Psychroflexus halocasei]
MAKKKRKKDPANMSFMDHLEDLRWHLVRSVLAILLGGAVAFVLKDITFGILFAPKDASFVTYDVLCQFSRTLGFEKSFCFDELPFRIQSRKVAGQFSAHIWTSITAGFIIAFPYVIYQFWSFLKPALSMNEQKYARLFIVFSSFLFFIGVLFGYYVITPLSINFLGNYTISSEVFNDFDLDSYIGLVRASVLACGLIFELPIIIYFLTKLGLVTPQFLRKHRKYALVFILIISAVITPPDIASQVIVAIPVLVLYEISIFISRIVVRRQKRRERQNA